MHSGSAVAGNPVLVAGTDGTNARSILTDTSGRQEVVGAVASGSAVAGNPVLTGGVDGVGANARTLTVAVDRAAMTTGSATGIPMIGQSSGVARIATVNRFGNVTPGYQTIMAFDPVEGSTINTWLWAQSTTTMTIAQSGGLLTLNSGAITTTTTDAILTTNKQFPIVNQAPISCSYRALLTQTINATIEIGFGAPAGTTAIINNGGFFRIQNSGQVKVVTSYNGTENVSSVLATLTLTSYYLFIVELEDNNAHFIIEDSNGIPVVDTSFALTLTTPDKAAVSHIPSFARVYTTGAAGVAPTVKISFFQAYQLGINTSKPWLEQMASSGRSSTINPTSFAQTGSSMTAAPATETPSNTVAGYSALGGEYATALTVASENPLSVFGFQVPAPYSFYLYGLTFSTAIVTTAISVTGIPSIEWMVIANCTSGNINTGGGQRFPVGVTMTYPAITAGIGTTLSSGNLTWKPSVPILCLPGNFIHIAYKVLVTTAVVTAGVTRGTVYVDGFFE